MKTLRMLNAGMALAVAGCASIKPMILAPVPEVPEPLPRTLEEVIQQDYCVVLQGDFSEEELKGIQYAFDSYLGVFDYRQIDAISFFFVKGNSFLTREQEAQISKGVDATIDSLKRRHLSYRRQLESVLNRYGLGEYRLETHDTSSEESILSAYESLRQVLLNARVSSNLGTLEGSAEWSNSIIIAPLDIFLDASLYFPESVFSYEATVVHEIGHVLTLDRRLGFATSPLQRDFRIIDDAVDARAKDDQEFDPRLGYVSDYACFHHGLPNLRAHEDRIRKMEYLEPALERIVVLARARKDYDALKLARNYLALLQEYHGLQTEAENHVASQSLTVDEELNTRREDIAETIKYFVLQEDSGIVVDEQQWREEYIPAKLAAVDSFFGTLRGWDSPLYLTDVQESQAYVIGQNPAMMYTPIAKE